MYCKSNLNKDKSFLCICLVVAANISIKTKLYYRCEATEGSTVLTTKEMPCLLDNHVSLTEVALEITY